ncbi:MAG: hypothetical protein RR840_06790 [Clostridium sp.]
MKVLDQVFGEVIYDHGWTKDEKVNLWDEEVTLTTIAFAYKGQDIVENQQKAYMEFLNKKQEYISRLEILVREYYDSLTKDIDLTPKGTIIPREILFDRDGSIAVMCDCKFDKDNGIAVKLYPSEEVVSQDEYL